MLAAALLSLAVDAPTAADGWVRVINIKPSDGSCPGDLQYTVPACDALCAAAGCACAGPLKPAWLLYKQTSRGVADAFYCSSAPMKVYGLVTPTGESYRALTPV